MRLLIILALMLTQSCVQVGINDANVCDGVGTVKATRVSEEEMEPYAGPEENNNGAEQILILNRIMNTL